MIVRECQNMIAALLKAIGAVFGLYINTLM